MKVRRDSRNEQAHSVDQSDAVPPMLGSDEEAAGGNIRRALGDKRLETAMGRVEGGHLDLGRVDPDQIKAAWDTGSVSVREAVLAGLREIVAESDRQPNDVARIMEGASVTLDDAVLQGVRLRDVIRRAVFHEGDEKIGIRLGAAKLASEMALRDVEMIPAADALLRLSRDPDEDVRFQAIAGLAAVHAWGVRHSSEPGGHRVAGEIVKTEAFVALERLSFDRSGKVLGAAQAAFERCVD